MRSLLAPSLLCGLITPRLHDQPVRRWWWEHLSIRAKTRSSCVNRAVPRCSATRLVTLLDRRIFYFRWLRNRDYCRNYWEKVREKLNLRNIIAECCICYRKYSDVFCSILFVANGETSVYKFLSESREKHDSTQQNGGERLFLSESRFYFLV